MLAAHPNAPHPISPVTRSCSGQADGCGWLGQDGTVHSLCFRIIHTPRYITPRRLCNTYDRQPHLDLFNLHLCFYSCHETFLTGTLNVYCFCAYWMWWGRSSLWNPSKLSTNLINATDCQRPGLPCWGPSRQRWAPQFWSGPMFLTVKICQWNPDRSDSWKCWEGQGLAINPSSLRLWGDLETNAAGQIDLVYSAQT